MSNKYKMNTEEMYSYLAKVELISQLLHEVIKNDRVYAVHNKSTMQCDPMFVYQIPGEVTTRVRDLDAGLQYPFKFSKTFNGVTYFCLSMHETLDIEVAKTLELEEIIHADRDK